MGSKGQKMEKQRLKRCRLKKDLAATPRQRNERSGPFSDWSQSFWAVFCPRRVKEAASLALPFAGGLWTNENSVRQDLLKILEVH